MTRAVLPWLLLLSSWSAPVLAQTTGAAPSPAGPDSAAGPANGSYPAAFFAANQPATALDMIAIVYLLPNRPAGRHIKSPIMTR